MMESRRTDKEALSANQSGPDEEYSKKRYLEHCTDDDLNQRFDDILGNSIRFTEDGQAVVQTPNSAVALMGHVLQEYILRGQSQISFRSLKNLHFGDAKYPNARRAATLWRDMRLHPPYLLKFSKRIFLEPMLDRGVIRIRSASSYRDEALPPSIRDNELQFDQSLHRGEVTIGDQTGWTVGPIRLSSTAASDYYISSYAVLFENRLFDDFVADACLIIHDPNLFDVRINRAFGAKLPGWAAQFNGIDYLDPLRPKSISDIHFTKHFRYAYQREARFVWVPPEPAEALKHIDLELEDLSSFCELISL